MIRDRYRIGNLDGWIELTPSQHGETYYEYQLSFDDDTPIVPQAFGMELTPDRFIREVAPATNLCHRIASGGDSRFGSCLPCDQPRSAGDR